jgi:hypothetical protein
MIAVQVFAALLHVANRTPAYAKNLIPTQPISDIFILLCDSLPRPTQTPRVALAWDGSVNRLAL